MMMCRKDSQKFFCQESGSLDDLMHTEWAGFLFKSKIPTDFCQFYIECLKSKNRDVPYCFYMRDTCSATASYKNDSKVAFYVPTCDKPHLIYKDTIENHQFLEVELPLQFE